MPKIPVHGRNAIRRAIKADYDRLKNYKKVGALWGLSDGTVHRFVNIKTFWPKSKEVNEAVKKHGLSIGIVVGVRPLPKEPIQRALPSREVSPLLLVAIDTAREILDSAEVPTKGRIIK